MKKYLAEFIGVFFLVLIIGCVVLEPGAGGFAPLAIGATLMVMIFATGHISGGHLNPAVTLSVFLRGKMPAADVPGYMLAQVVGALLASGVVIYLKCSAGTCAECVPKNIAYAPAWVAEFLGTFALTFVVLNVATAKGTSGNSFYGLAIGFTVLAMAYALGGISGGAFNPAVGISLVIMGLVPASALLVYFTACLAAGAASAYTFRYLTGEKN